jgi:hypothetical protein
MASVASIAFRCSVELNGLLSERAKVEGVSKSALIVTAVEQYLGLPTGDELAKVVDRHSEELTELRAMIKKLGTTKASS